MADASKKKQVDPNDYGSCAEFVDDCVDQMMSDNSADDEDDAEERCQTMWDEQRSSAIPIRKAHADESNSGMEFVLSDATPDRYGDVIQAEGWDLANFKKNPIALFNHNSDFPIGKWENLSVQKGALRGHLKMAPAGSSARIDEIRALIEAGILRAVSVGFRPIESKPLSKSVPGELYLKSELVETSLVSVPANPNALAVAKSLHVSDDTMSVVFKTVVARQRRIKHVVTTGLTPGLVDWQGKKIPDGGVVQTIWLGHKIIKY